ncbi:MAG TPA: hypothetical protein ENI24_05155 [Methylophaga sp.]|nr:hypothetical protein [Methylophaga sp.]
MSKSFFDYYPDNVFNLLVGENKCLYLGIISVLFRSFFDDTSDYNDVSVSDTLIRNKVKLELIERNTLIDEDTQQLVSINDGADIQSYTNRIYSRFVECGWLKVDQQGHKKHVLMSPKIIELLEFLESAGRNLSSDVGGSVFSIYHTLKGLHNDNRITPNDIVAGLSKAVEDSRLIARRMGRLAHFIRDMSEKVGEISSSSKKVDLFFDSYIKESSFRDYKDFKGPNHPFRFKSDIIKLINEFEYDVAIRVHFSDAISSINGTSREQAGHELVVMLSKIRTVFANADYSLNRIETCNLKLVRRVTESVKYQRRNTQGNERFKEVLQLLRGRSDIENLAVANSLPAIFALSDEAAYRPKQKKKPIKQGTGSMLRNVSEEELLAQQEKRQYMDSIKVTERSLYNWLSLILAGKDRVTSLDISIETPFEFFAFVQARRLCLGSEEFRSSFAKTYVDYQFTTISEKLIDHGVVICRQFDIAKK